MPEPTVLILDRKNLGIVRVRTRLDSAEPVKVRVCRSCWRVHAEADASCSAP